MIQKRNGNRRKSKKDSLRNLTHKQINTAVGYYLGHGGKITRIETVKEQEQKGIDQKAIADFLCDSGNHIGRDYPEDYFG